MNHTDMTIVNVQCDAGEWLPGAETSPADAAGAAIEQHIARQGLAAQDLHVHFDTQTHTATVTGTAPDQNTREKIVVCCGNVRGVAQVRDLMDTVLPAQPSRYYTVAGGDTLPTIAQHHYRNGLAYGRIFEANRPMLRDPGQIYPGQLLRIPQ